MKLDELRELREAAAVTSEGWDWSPAEEARLRLEKMAPDLARLVCELGEALEQIDSDLDLLTGSLPNAMRRTVRTALASLAELGER